MTERQAKWLRKVIRKSIPQTTDIMMPLARLLGFTESNIRRAMTVIGEKTYRMNIEPATLYAQNTVAPKFKYTPTKRKPDRMRFNKVAQVAQQQLRGVVPYSIVLEYVKNGG